VFVNDDLIAAGLSPFQPEAAAFRAGRLMLEEIAQHAGTIAYELICGVSQRVTQEFR